MKKWMTLLVLATALQAAPLFAQYTLRLVVTDIATRKLEDIYVAGSFNNWNPDDAQYKLKPFGPSRRAIVLKNLPSGKYAFKFTRGGMDKVETTAKGADIPNREVEINGADVSVNLQIPGWKDDYPDKPKPNTASPQVRLLDTALLLPKLNRTRRIWIYLPKSYNATKGRSYPVLYMQDGQNLFNEQTATNGEWGVDESLDTLQKKTGKECIVIGIESDSTHRMTEYNPYNHDQYGKGEGQPFAEFLAKTLKPYIDQHYRTIKDPAHTWIAGSSMGALLSLYAVMQYPDVFGAAGIFSPAFRLAPDLYTAVEQTKWTSQPRFYFYAGGKESNTMVADMDRIIGLIEKKNRYDLRRSYYPPGQHNEAAWRKEFADFYQWLIH